MVSAAVKTFTETPSVENLKVLKKPELIELAQELGVEEIKVSMRKPAIVRKLAEFLVDEDILGEDDLDHFPDPSERKPMTEMEAKIKMMELEMAKQEKERENSQRKLFLFC